MRSRPKSISSTKGGLSARCPTWRQTKTRSSRTSWSKTPCGGFPKWGSTGSASTPTPTRTRRSWRSSPSAFWPSTPTSSCLANAGCPVQPPRANTSPAAACPSPTATSRASRISSCTSPCAMPLAKPLRGAPALPGSTACWGKTVFTPTPIGWSRSSTTTTRTAGTVWPATPAAPGTASAWS